VEYKLKKLDRKRCKMCVCWWANIQDQILRPKSLITWQIKEILISPLFSL
jgi:hypothetical protein